ncbi:spore coat protein U domain-containing protein [Sphingomonas echinoides]|uniref:spore coat protein U domain-containing protein n=1 Tax=Sphingomonas echinoides TaxID=59803 RepID=UPI0024133F6E|nr:spore coat protein U domain-containing protein [Sphingomonas echinoides]
MNPPGLLFRPFRIVAAALLLTILGMVGWVGPAQAQSCAISAVPMAFGAYNPLTKAAVNTTATVTTTCTALIIAGTYSIAIGAGQGATPATRYLDNNGNRLNYQIYTDAARTRVAGDGVAGTSMVTGTIAPLVGLITASRTDTLYGTIAGGQSAVPGSYGDTIILQLTY